MTGRVGTIATDPGAQFFFVILLCDVGGGEGRKEMRVMVYVPKQTKASHIKLCVVSLHFILHAPHFKGGVGGGGVQRGPTKQGIIKQFSLKCSRSHQTQMLV